MSYQIGGGAGGPSGPSQSGPQQMRISTTQTVTVAPSRTTTAQPTLRLRGQVRSPEERTENARGIRWAEDVVDNEGLGRKSSKVCCIYHAPKQNIDDSSSESDDSSSSDDSDSGDDGAARPVGGVKRGRDHKHKHGKECKKKPSPNAYEKMPKVKPRNNGGGIEKK